MAGRQQRQHAGMAVSQRLVRVGDRRFFAGMGGGGEPDRPVGHGVQHRFERRFVCAKRPCGVFQIAGNADLVSPQHSEARRVFGILCKRDLEGAEQSARKAREAAPALERGGRHARVQQRRRHALSTEFAKHVRPEFRLDPKREVGAPVLQETAHPGRPVHGIVLMDCALRQPPRQQGGGGAGNRGGQHRCIRAHCGEPVDQRQDGSGLANAGPVEPHQGPSGRAAPAMPRRSSRRAGSSRPRRRRWAT